MRMQVAVLLGIVSTVALTQDPRIEGTAAPAKPAAGSSLDPAVRAALVPALAAWIVASRDGAVGRGVDPIPAAVRAALHGYVPGEVLDRVRWRVDDGVVSVMQAIFRYGYTPAVTLDDVVIFAHADGAADAALWAHELVHVMQYRDWGVDGFAERYLADYEAVERDAVEFRWQWLKATGRVPRP